ncbi:hypothetical protein [Butyrivibrio sp. FC2001]|uniref:hypothetical protein n=1 Tax=Butyrivibrio sp. FC2001 TaxID=1280671 RepID=UPI000406B1EF|nr:hypothetical protein [Butyrivibrio sp. FC2001]
MSYSIIYASILGWTNVCVITDNFDERWLTSKIKVDSSSIAYSLRMSQFFVWPVIKRLIILGVTDNKGKIVGLIVNMKAQWL